MTKHRTADAQDRARPAVAPRGRRRTVGRPRTGAVAAIGIGLLFLVGVGQVVTPRVSESEVGELAYALWSNPVPSFVAVRGGGAAPTRGLVPAEPPRVLGVPDTAAGGTRMPGGESGNTGAKNTGRGAGTTTAGSGRGVGPAGLGSMAGAGRDAGASAVVPAPGTPAAGIPIQVYFSHHPDSDATFTAVSAVKRTAPDRGVAAAALAELIDGPTTQERDAGYFSELGRSLSGPSSCDGRDFQVSVREGVATVRFCRAMTSAGIGQDARVRAQIEATLTQFSTIRSVRVLGANGRCLFDQSGQDRCLVGAASAS